MASASGSTSLVETFDALSMEPQPAEASAPCGGTCPICLEEFDLVDMAMVPGCEHVYCVYCIIQWSTTRDPCSCPQCKRKFDTILCFRQLDGTVTDHLHQEGLCLLRRANWYQAKLKKIEQEAPLRRSGTMVHEDDYYYGYDEDDIDEVEDYYFSSAAGHARIVLGNRRFGRSGYISAGHNYAQPVERRSKKGKEKKVTPETRGSNQNPQGNSSSQGSASGSSSAVGGQENSVKIAKSSSGGGRRSRRKAKRGSVVGWE